MVDGIRKMSVVVVCCNEKDYHRAEKTLEDIRVKGKWVGDLVWVAIDFDPSVEFVRRWNIRLIKKPAYDMLWLWKLRRKRPFRDTDGRELYKLIQFSKWRVFAHELKLYKSLLYIDTGMHINHPIAPIFTIDHKDKFVAPDDRFPFDDPSKVFKKQWDCDSWPEKFQELEDYCRDELLPDTLEKNGYFLNCMWLMDTSLIKPDTQQELMGFARRFPISRTNEMAVMNLYFLKNWQPLPEKVGELRVFDWTERGECKTDDYIMLKYPKIIK